MISQRIAFLGTGSMGGAILAGLLASGFERNQVTVTTKSAARANHWKASLEVEGFSTEEAPNANAEVAATAEIVVLGVKPAGINPLLAEISSSLRPGATVISIAAGITLASMRETLGQDSKVNLVRSLPNTPALVGRGFTGLSGETAATGAEAAMANAKALFATVGRVLEVSEAQLDALSTVSGSGPAYVFYLIEEMTAAAEALGFDRDSAAAMVRETFLGASLLLEQTGQSPQELRAQVTSPNGTTMRAVARLEQAELAGVFEDAMRAALARAREIAEQGR